MSSRRVARIALLVAVGVASLATQPVEPDRDFEPGPAPSDGWGRAERTEEPVTSPASWAGTITFQVDPPSAVVYDRTIVVDVTALGAGARSAQVRLHDADGTVLLDTTVDAGTSLATWRVDDRLDAAALSGEPWSAELPLAVEVTEGTVALRVRATMTLDGAAEGPESESFAIDVAVVPDGVDTGG